MTDRPIIFSAPMIRALLEGRKTQTRRLEVRWNSFYQDWAFRPIINYPDYIAGRDGNIYTLKGDTPRALKGSPTSKGYLTVSLCYDGNISTKYIHTLIAESWLGPRPQADWQVRHLNAVRTDNTLANLDWGTVADNWSDRLSLEHGVHENHHAAKLTMDKANYIRSSLLSQRKLALEFGVSQSVIWDIKQGRIWSQAPQASGRNIALPDPPKLWVREAWAVPALCEVQYRATDTARIGHWDPASGPWNSPIHMPRWASRLTLIVTDVRVQRLQDISGEDTVAEGISLPRCGCEVCAHSSVMCPADASAHIEEYAILWETLHGKSAWVLNPWVAALTFTVHKANIDALPAAATGEAA